MPTPKFGAIRGNAAALVAVLAAYAVTSLTWPLFQPTPMVLFYAAVVFATWMGGVRPGILAVVLSAAVGYLAFLPPYGAFGTEPKQLGVFAAFLAVASMFVWLIADRQRAADREAEQGRWFAATLASVGDAVIATDTEGRVTFLNDVAERLTGWTAGEAAGRELDEVFSIFREGTRERTESPVKRALETGHIVGLANHTVLVAKDGRETAIEDSAAPIKDDLGAIRGVILVFRDATERRRGELAHETVQANEQRLRVLVTASSDVVYRMSPDWAEMQPLDGRGLVASNEGPIRNWMEKNLPASEHDRVREAIRRAIAARATFELEHQVIRPDGSRGWTFSRAVPILDDEGTIVEWFGTASDVTRRKEAEEAAFRRARQLQRLADIATRINAAHDVQSVVRVVTEEARHLVGARQSATSIAISPLQPEPLSIVSTAEEPLHEPEESAIRARDLYEAVNAENQPVRLAQSELEQDPRWKTLEKVALVKPVENGWLAAPLIARSGQALGLLQLADKAEGEFTEDDEAILVQLSRLASIAVENARLYEELRGNDRRKDEFLAMLAHELRNPLSAIGNAVTLTTKGGLHEHIEWSMDVITRQMKHLTRLIDDLLDVSRITQGKIQLHKQVIDAVPVLRHAVETVKPLVEERKHEVLLSFTTTDMRIEADATRLEQMLVNLLTNAAKYTPAGGRIQLIAGMEGGNFVCRVRDNGVGIPPELLSRMFDLFAQADQTLARSEGGLGIGLTLVRSLAELHGGTVAATSDGPDKGSEFVLRLPSGGTPETQEEDPTKVTTALPLLGMRVLVVDDNEDTANGMARLLRLSGHTVRVAHCGLDAIESAREHRPEVVMLDIGLPGMDGYQVAAQLRREECCKEALIIAVSGYGEEGARTRSGEAGFDHHLVKPVNFETLLVVMERARDRPSN